MSERLEARQLGKIGSFQDVVDAVPGSEITSSKRPGDPT